MMLRGRLRSWIGLGLLAELVVFVLVAERIGLGSAIALSILSTIFGIAMLRRSGLSAWSALQQVQNGGLDPGGRVIDGLFGALGAVLLIVPGFLSDLIGLMLLAPGVRQAIAQRLGLSLDAAPKRPRRPEGGHVIDLGAGDFTRLDGASTPRG